MSSTLVPVPVADAPGVPIDKRPLLSFLRRTFQVPAAKSLPHKARLEDAAFEHKEARRRNEDAIDRMSHRVRSWFKEKPHETRVSHPVNAHLEGVSLARGDHLSNRKK